MAWLGESAVTTLVADEDVWVASPGKYALI